MKGNALRLTILAVLVCAFSVLGFLLVTPKAGSAGPVFSGVSLARLKQVQDELAKYQRDEATVKKNLETFDTLDFVVFSNQAWTRLHESHSQAVIVDWPDGHHTDGIDRHIKDLKALFVPAPDTQIKIHPVRFGAQRGAAGSLMAPDGTTKVSPLASGEGFTCVTGIMTGTFTKPMPIGGGKFIQPTGKKFSVPMCTVGRWKDGVMVEEWLYWDNATYMKQIGAGS